MHGPCQLLNSPLIFKQIQSVICFADENPGEKMAHPRSLGSAALGQVGALLVPFGERSVTFRCPVGYLGALVLKRSDNSGGLRQI